MIIKQYGIQFDVNPKALETLQGEVVVIDQDLTQSLEERCSRQIYQLYLLCDSNESPVVLVEWKYFLNESDQFELLYLDFTKDEQQALYDMEIL